MLLALLPTLFRGSFSPMLLPSFEVKMVAPVCWSLALHLECLPQDLVAASQPRSGIRQRGRFFGGEIEAVFELMGPVLPNECFGSGVIDVKEGGGLSEKDFTSLIDRPSMTTFLKNLTLILIGILAYLFLSLKPLTFFLVLILSTIF